MPTEPLDEQFVQALAGLLAEIRVANGYHSDAGEHVLTEQMRTALPEDVVTLAILDANESLSEGANGNGQGLKRRSGRFQVTVQVALPVVLKVGGVPTPQPVRQQARRIMADVRRAVASQRFENFITGIIGIDITGRTLPPLDEGSSFQFANVDLDVRFTENHLPKE